jgi:hypothetical protein
VHQYLKVFDIIILVGNFLNLSLSLFSVKKFYLKPSSSIFGPPPPPTPKIITFPSIGISQTVLTLPGFVVLSPFFIFLLLLLPSREVGLGRKKNSNKDFIRQCC